MSITQEHEKNYKNYITKYLIKNQYLVHLICLENAIFYFKVFTTDDRKNVYIFSNCFYLQNPKMYVMAFISTLKIPKVKVTRSTIEIQVAER